MHHAEKGEEKGFFGGWPGRQRLQRGDMTPIILHVLQEKPMHGYELIRTFEERSHGFWRPSAGSIYPTLQLLEEQELVVGKEQDGKKVYELTEKGQKAAGERHFGHRFDPKHRSAADFRQSLAVFHEIMASLKSISFSGSEEASAEARAILTEARDRLRSLASASEQTQNNHEKE